MRTHRVFGSELDTLGPPKSGLLSCSATLHEFLGPASASDKPASSESLGGPGRQVDGPSRRFNSFRVVAGTEIPFVGNSDYRSSRMRLGSLSNCIEFPSAGEHNTRIPWRSVRRSPSSSRDLTLYATDEALRSSA